MKIAQEFCDKAAERRAHCNLANAHVFLNQIEDAIHHYRETMRLTQELQDRLMEAQAAYSLGNCYTLMHDYEKAIEFHTLHLQIACELDDRVGESRAYWSLSNSFASLGRNDEALTYARKHLEVSHELRDHAGSAAASTAISELKKLISSAKLSCASDSIDSRVPSASCGSVTPKMSKRLSMDQMQLLKLTPGVSHNQDEAASSNFHLNILQSSDSQASDSVSGMIRGSSSSSNASARSVATNATDENVHEFTERGKINEFNCERNKENRQPGKMHRNVGGGGGGGGSGNGNINAAGNRRTGKSNMLSRSISSPVCPVASNRSTAASCEASSRDSWPDEMFDLIAGIQGNRMDEQRAQLPPSRRTCIANGVTSVSSTVKPSVDTQATMNQSVNVSGKATTATRATLRSSSRQLSLEPSIRSDDDFFEMLMKCQGSRLEEQRSSLPPTAEETNVVSSVSMLKRSSQCASITGDNITRSNSSVPDDDFFSLILQFQSGRIEDQRSNLPASNASKSKSKK